MKRIILLFVLLFFIFSMSSLAFASGDWRYLETKYTRDAPDEFTVSSFIPYTTESVQEKFQNAINFRFVDGMEMQESFVVIMDTTDDYNEYKIALKLTYKKKDLKKYDDVFITGTFDYYHTSDGVIDEFSGDVIGQIVLINPSSHNLMGLNNEDVGALVLRLSAPKEGFLIDFFLNPSGTGLLMTDPELEPVYDNENNCENEDYYGHEHRPHIPSPSNQTDVAVGVGLSTVGIAVANAFSGTSIFGNASFNGSFNPTSPTAPSAPTPGAQPTPGGSGGIIGTIKDFFKNLFANLREMLTDEGRSYANGKLTDTLKDIIPDDIEKE
ncbi:MAG: hypothetical protein J7L77_05955 [Clostridiales bacterium]|nr:hypothetical protein [Clostridiales bacterium]